MTTEYRVYELKADVATAAATPPRAGKIVRVALTTSTPRTPGDPPSADARDRAKRD